MEVINDLKKFRRSLIIRMALMLMGLFLIQSAISLFLKFNGIESSMIILTVLFNLVFILLLSQHLAVLSDVTGALKSLKELKNLYEEEVITENTFDTLVYDLFHREALLLQFKKDGKLSNLYEIEKIDKYTAPIEKTNDDIDEYSMKVYINVNKSVVRSFLVNVYNRKNTFFNGERYFYKILLNIYRRGTESKKVSDKK